MKVVISGGCGFLGQRVASAIIDNGSLCGENVHKIILVDKFKAPLASKLQNDDRVVVQEKDIALPGAWDDLVDEPGQCVFHLAAIMSGQGEQDFDLCMDVNLRSFMSLMERCRKLGELNKGLVRVLFSSTAAVFGPLPLVTDDTKCVPLTTYGTTKAMCELLLNDYSRKGFVDGRAARLPTVLVRPGKPNAATTSCYSGVVREPLDGVDVVLPVADNLQHAAASTSTIIGGIVGLIEVPHAVVVDKLGQDRAVNIPSFSVTLKELGDAMTRVVEQDGIMEVSALGKITCNPDERLNRIVGSMMSSTDSSRAVSIGLPTNPELDVVIREYIHDYWQPRPPKASL